MKLNAYKVIKLNKYRNTKLNGFKKILYKYIENVKKNYININTELNVYQIIEYCYNRLANPPPFDYPY